MTKSIVLVRNFVQRDLVFGIRPVLWGLERLSEEEMCPGHLKPVLFRKKITSDILWLFLWLWYTA